jgi:hypothetical protein
MQVIGKDLAPGETYLQRFAKESARGGLIGLLEMAAEFLRTFRFP